MNSGRAFCTILPGTCNSRTGSCSVRNYWTRSVNLNNCTFPTKMPQQGISDPAGTPSRRHHSIPIFLKHRHLTGVYSSGLHPRAFATCSRIRHHDPTFFHRYCFIGQRITGQYHNSIFFLFQNHPLDSFLLLVPGISQGNPFTAFQLDISLFISRTNGIHRNSGQCRFLRL